MKQLELARPYAKAAFEFAREKKKLADWEKVLGCLASAAQNHNVREYIGHPLVSDMESADLMLSILGKACKIRSKDVQNFVKTMAYFKKLLILPEVYSIYEEYLSEEKCVIRAQATSAVKLNAKQQSEIKSALEKKYNQSVSLECDIDKSLIGGVKLRVGDWVMDNSLKARLTRLCQNLGEHSHE